MNTVTRDSLIQGVITLGAVLAYLSAHSGLVPAQYQELVKDAAALCGVISASLMASPLRHSANTSDPSFDWKKVFGK